MAYKIVMPQLGLTMEEGAVTSWQKQPGEWVEKGDVIFTVETDKVEMEVEAMSKGYLGKSQVPIGQIVPVGTLLAMLTDEPEADGA
jgi:pyruvate/2-oxoglutarate dehydrogenase complex dihydrolipoamide acyltransferase (E2) component